RTCSAWLTPYRLRVPVVAACHAGRRARITSGEVHISPDARSCVARGVYSFEQRRGRAMAVPAVGDLEAAVQRLAPLIREHADASERARRVAPAVIDALRESNVFDLMVPRSLGGLEADPATLVRVIEDVSIAD